MSKSIDYYLSLVSPWTYLGHQRLLDIAARHQATVNIWPVDFSLIFPTTGGLPLPKRAPARQAYRLQELQRWRDYLHIPLTLEPRYFPTSDKLAAAMVINLRQQQPDAALQLAGACLRACWAEERNLNDRDTLLTIANKLQLDGEALLANTEQAQQIMVDDSNTALQRSVFGAPSFIYQEQLFWGQDRLDFLDRALTN